MVNIHLVCVPGDGDMSGRRSNVQLGSIQCIQVLALKSNETAANRGQHRPTPFCAVEPHAGMLLAGDCQPSDEAQGISLLSLLHLPHLVEPSVQCKGLQAFK